MGLNLMLYFCIWHIQDAALHRNGLDIGNIDNSARFVWGGGGVTPSGASRPPPPRRFYCPYTGFRQKLHQKYIADAPLSGFTTNRLLVDNVGKFCYLRAIRRWSILDGGSEGKMCLGEVQRVVCQTLWLCQTYSQPDPDKIFWDYNIFS